MPPTLIQNQKAGFKKCEFPLATHSQNNPPRPRGEVTGERREAICVATEAASFVPETASHRGRGGGRLH